MHSNTSKQTQYSTPQRPPQAPRLVPVNKWPDYHDWPSVAGLRWLIFNAEQNGFDKVIRRVGRRVLIDERSFFDWVEEQNAR